MREDLELFYKYTWKQIFQKASLLYTSGWLPWIIICFGVILRLVQYLFNRSLWLDESFLALNIINRSFLELLQPLDYYQGAPIGFLMLEKYAVQSFGNSEYALRFVPFLSGIISLILFYNVTKHYVKQDAVLIALGLFAISGPLIYYSSEAKQYSSDVAIALLLYSIAIYVHSKGLTTLNTIIFGAIGATAIWFSHPSLFILAGIGVCLMVIYIKRKEWSKVGRLSAAYLIWALSFIANYFISLRNLGSSEVLLDYWKNSFMPFPPSLLDAKWFVMTFFDFFDNQSGLTLVSSVAALTFIVGCFSMYLRNKELFFLMLSPAFFALLASGFHMYPFSGRFLLFIVPSMILFIAEGLEHIIDKTRNNSAIIGIAFVILLLFVPLLSASFHLIKPKSVEEIKPVLSYLKEHKQDGDILYLYYGSTIAFKYYAESYGFKENDYIIGLKSKNYLNYINDLNKLQGNKRVWILFSHINKNEEEFFLSYLESVGKRLDSIERVGASAYLYDLRLREII